MKYIEIKEIYPIKGEYGNITTYDSCQSKVNELIKSGWEIIQVNDFPNSWTHNLKSYVLGKPKLTQKEKRKDEF